MGCAKTKLPTESGEASARECNTKPEGEQKPTKEVVFTVEELQMLDSFWANLKGSSNDSGLYILEHFFTLFPEEMKSHDRGAGATADVKKRDPRRRHFSPQIRHQETRHGQVDDG